jgi:hypothetical protein
MAYRPVGQASSIRKHKLMSEGKSEQQPLQKITIPIEWHVSDNPKGTILTPKRCEEIEWEEYKKLESRIWNVNKMLSE